MSKIFTNPAQNVTLTISEDKLSAWLTVHKSGRLIDEQDILALIDEAGIKFGFEDALRYIRTNNLQKEFDQPFPIAMCKAGTETPTPRYYFDMAAARRFDPIIEAADVAHLTCVEEGTVLADLSESIFATQSSIYNVLGEMIVTGEEQAEYAQRIVGKNVEYIAEKGRFISTCAGYIGMDEDGKINVYNTLIINGDVVGIPDLRTPVDLLIQGGIQRSFLAVQGNIKVEGDVQFSGINCGGDLSVGGSIVFCRPNGLEVLGDLSCGIIRHSKILIKGNLSCGHIQGSEVVGEKGVYLKDKAGVIHSSIQSAQRIEADFVGGAEPGSEVNLEITISPFLKSLLLQLTRELVNAKQNASLEKINDLSARIGAIEKELDNELNSFLNREIQEPAGVKILNDVHPVVHIQIHKHEYQIRKHQTGLSIDEKN
ncbi:MAG: FapA family protein [Candidatus Cloacimonadaceae bacterium]